MTGCLWSRDRSPRLVSMSKLIRPFRNDQNNDLYLKNAELLGAISITLLKQEGVLSLESITVRVVTPLEDTLSIDVKNKINVIRFMASGNIFTKSEGGIATDLY